MSYTILQKACIKINNYNYTFFVEELKKEHKQIRSKSCDRGKENRNKKEYPNRSPSRSNRRKKNQYVSKSRHHTQKNIRKTDIIYILKLCKSPLYHI